MTTTVHASKIIKKIIPLLELNHSDEVLIENFKKIERILSFRNESLATFLLNSEKRKIKELTNEIKEVIKDIKENSSSKLYIELQNQTPKGILELLRIKGLGAKKILTLTESLNIKNIEDLQNAINTKQINSIKGFAEKSIDSLKKSIEFYLKYKGFFRLDTHEAILDEIKNHFKRFNNLQIQETGSTLDKDEIFESIDFEVNATQSDEIIEKLKELGFVFRYSKSEYIALERNEIKIKLFNVTQPTIRPRKSSIIRLSDIKGVIHSHTNYSDGNNTIEEMAHASKELGYDYIVISDHSQSAKYANGLSPKRVTDQQLEINKLNKNVSDFEIISGIESDILINGDLDYDENILKTFSIVISSIHSNFEMDENTMTNRIIKAISNKYTKILAHPTGRLLLERAGYEINIEKILDKCRENSVIIELNCNPKRLDLSWKNLGLAKELGIKVCLSPDAHSIEQLEYLKYGVMLANKVGLRKEDLVNTLNIEEFKKTYAYDKRAS